MTSGLLACGLCVFSPSSSAETRITQVETDGRVRDVSVDGSTTSAPLRIASKVRTMRLHFTEADNNGKPPPRPRYKLEGHDDTQHDLPVRMRAIIYFRDRCGQVVGSSESYPTGETPGWRGKAARNGVAWDSKYHGLELLCEVKGKGARIAKYGTTVNPTSS